MIIIALGSNVAGPWGTPKQTILRALTELNHAPCKLVMASKLLDTKAFGKTDQPDFTNAVAEITTHLKPVELLAHLQFIECQAGRERLERWGPRTLDLDIIDYHSQISHDPNLLLPHPGIAAREFVLVPLAEIAPRWCHPVTQLTPQQMLRLLSSG